MIDKTESQSIRQSIKKLEKYVRLLSVMRRITSLDRVERESLLALGDALSDAGKLANDAVTSEDVAVIVVSLGRCRDQLELFRKALLAASQYDLVDAADVAQLSALADQIIDAITADIRQMR